jgi:hypothetical protein
MLPQSMLEEWDVDGVVRECGSGSDCDERISQALRGKMAMLQVMCGL